MPTRRDFILGASALALAVPRAARAQADWPNKPIRFVVNSHPHFDHASGLAAAVAEGATILTHNNNEKVLEHYLETTIGIVTRPPGEPLARRARVWRPAAGRSSYRP